MKNEIENATMLLPVSAIDTNRKLYVIDHEASLLILHRQRSALKIQGPRAKFRILPMFAKYKPLVLQRPSTFFVVQLTTIFHIWLSYDQK